MSQIKKKFIQNDSIDNNKILLLNNGAMKAMNAAGSASVSLFKLNASDKLEFVALPQVKADPSAGDDVARKSWVDTEVAAVQSDVDAVEGRMDTAEADIQALEDKLGVANGIATLDGNGLVLASQLPSYVDDVLEFADLASFPATGETGKIYVAKDTNKTYRWSGSAYIYITSGAVDTVNGYTGVVVLQSSDITLPSMIRNASTVHGALDALDLDLQLAESAIQSLQAGVWAFYKEKFTLTSTNISNGYIDLAHEVEAASIHAFVDRLAIFEDDDYTISVVGGKTRMTFSGSLASGGDEELEAGDVIQVKYAKQ